MARVPVDFYLILLHSSIPIALYATSATSTLNDEFIIDDGVVDDFVDDTSVMVPTALWRPVSAAPAPVWATKCRGARVFCLFSLKARAGRLLARVRFDARDLGNVRNRVCRKYRVPTPRRCASSQRTRIHYS